MLSQNGPYSGLLRAIFEDKLKGLIGRPNCRTRSVLRRYPVQGETPPRPVRRWGGEEFGIVDATPEEKKKLWEDDLLLWHMIFLQLVSTYLKRARQQREEGAFALEQPATPKAYMPETVSFWDTEEWKQLKNEFHWNEVSFQQKSLGCSTAKPTTFAGNLDLRPEEHYLKEAASRPIRSSADLARRAPGIMHMLAKSLLETCFRRTPSLKAMSWEEHVLFGHVPARKDCWVCQRNQQGSPHHKLECCLSTRPVPWFLPMTRVIIWLVIFLWDR